MAEINLVPKRMTFTLIKGINAEKQTFVEVSREMDGLLIKSLSTKEEILIEYSKIRNVKIVGMLEEDTTGTDTALYFIGVLMGSLFKWFCKSMLSSNKRIPTFNIEYYDEFKNLKTIVLEVYNISANINLFIDRIQDIVQIN